MTTPEFVRLMEKASDARKEPVYLYIRAFHVIGDSGKLDTRYMSTLSKDPACGEWRGLHRDLTHALQAWFGGEDIRIDWRPAVGEATHVLAGHRDMPEKHTPVKIS